MRTIFSYTKVMTLVRYEKGARNLRNPENLTAHTSRRNMPSVANRSVLLACPLRRNRVQRRFLHQDATHAENKDMGETRAALKEGMVSICWTSWGQENKDRFYTII